MPTEKKRASAPKQRTTKAPAGKDKKAVKHLTEKQTERIIKAVEESGKSIREVLALLKK